MRFYIIVKNRLDAYLLVPRLCLVTQIRRLGLQFSWNYFQALPGNADPEARPPIFIKSLRGRARVKSVFTRSQALPGNADPEARPPIFMKSLRGRARVKSLPGICLETS